MRQVKQAIRNGLILGYYLSGMAALRRAMLFRRYGTLDRVVCFHWIGQEGAAGFEDKLIWLKRHYDLRPLADLIAPDRPRSSKPPLLAVTFDDGFADLAQIVLPILERHQVPITLFFPSDALALTDDGRKQFGRSNIGIDRPILSPEQLDLLLASGLVDVQSHTKSHYNCGLGSDETLREELGESRTLLEAKTGRPVDQFAYPYGSLTNTSLAARNALKACEYTAAWTIIPGFNHCDSDRFMLHRDSLGPNMNSLLFRAWLSGAYDVFKHMRNRQNHVR